METDEYQPVETVEAQPLRRGAPEHDNLLPKHRIWPQVTLVIGITR